MSQPSRLLILLAILCAWAGSVSRAAQAQDVSLPFTTSDLVGEWRSDGCQPTQLAAGGLPVPLARAYSYSEAAFVVRYTFYSEGCREPLYAFVTTGPYELGPARPDLDRTREATIFIDHAYFVAFSEEGRAALGACGRGMPVGEFVDKIASGCGALAPVNRCIGDHELFRIADGVFYPGLRTPDMCRSTGRPTATQSVGARKTGAIQ